MDFSEWIRNVKRFVSRVNAHQRVTSTEGILNNQVDGMTGCRHQSGSSLRHCCHGPAGGSSRWVQGKEAMHGLPLTDTGSVGQQQRTNPKSWCGTFL